MPRVGATAHKASAAPTEGLLKVSGEPGTQGCPAAISTSSSPSASVAPVPACSLQDIRNDMLGASKEALSRECGLSMDLISTSPQRMHQQNYVTSNHDSDDSSSSDDENADPRFIPPPVPRSPRRATAQLRFAAQSGVLEEQEPASIIAQDSDRNKRKLKTEAAVPVSKICSDVPIALPQTPPAAPEKLASLMVPPSPELGPRLRTPPPSSANRLLSTYGIEDTSVLSPGTAAALAVARSLDAAESASIDYDDPSELDLKYKTPPRSSSASKRGRSLSNKYDSTFASSTASAASRRLAMMTSPSFRNDKGAEQEDAKTLKMMYHALVLPGSGESMASIALEEIARDIPGALSIQHHLDCIHKTFFGDEPVKAKKENTIDESSIIMSPSHSYILQHALPQITRELLNRPLSWSFEEASVLSMQLFLQRTLNVIVLLLQRGENILCNTLTRIFDGSRQFYLDTVLDLQNSNSNGQSSQYEHDEEAPNGLSKEIAGGRGVQMCMPQSTTI